MSIHCVYIADPFWSQELARKRLSAASGAYFPPMNGDESEGDPNAEFEMQHQSVSRSC
jgi:hypothetical protein